MNNKDKIIEKIHSLNNRALQKTCEVILDNEKFFDWPASLSFHHAYRGGLAEHTLEVCNIAESIREIKSIQFSNRDAIVVSCLFHDFLKTEEYLLVDSPIEGQRNLITEIGIFIKPKGQDAEHAHIVNGANKFEELANSFGVEEIYVKKIKHCILAHHGPVKEWGSPEAPKNLEALIVHQADMLSAHAGISK